jgi:predicted ABC-type transport system involved in lysophospholipase L1 biosynthesis ATPase subunit
MAEPLVAFEEVALRSPGGRTILAGVDWTLERGGRVRIAGGRGSGATALLRLCAGLAHPQLGRVVLDGFPHHPFRFDHPYLRRGAVAWVPQAGELISNLTLLENVALPLRFVHGREQEEAEEASFAVLSRLGLGAEAGHRPDALNSQERKLGPWRVRPSPGPSSGWSTGCSTAWTRRSGSGPWASSGSGSSRPGSRC